jgi:hypothetical protein
MHSVSKLYETKGQLNGKHLMLVMMYYVLQNIPEGIAAYSKMLCGTY